MFIPRIYWSAYRCKAIKIFHLYSISEVINTTEKNFCLTFCTSAKFVSAKLFTIYFHNTLKQQREGIIKAIVC